MDRRGIMGLARELSLPEPVLEPLEWAAEKLPEDLPVYRLSLPETAEKAWEAVSAQVPRWLEDDGMAHLAVTLAAACRTRTVYRECGIPDGIYLATMGCLPRFLRESKGVTGRWAFDRGFWTWRQTGGLLFRLGTLEFEFRTLKENEPIPDGLAAGDRVCSVHIPSDAVLTREELERSYGALEWFLHGDGSVRRSMEAPIAVLCESWLLAPALDELLPEDSGIRRFAGAYERYAVRENDQEFYRWLFQCEPPLPPEDLPERTGLQRAAKARLAAGGKIGMAYGRLKRLLR